MVQKKYTNKELAEWLQTKARTAAGFRRNILANDERSKDTTVIGRMFFFKYDPKWKDILPIYDKFPMVFPIERYPDGFLGLNLHYLDYGQRLYLIQMLSKFANNKKITPTTRLKLSYDLLQSTKMLNNLSRPCIKRYLFSHVRSKFIEINPDEWDKAAALPVEMFVTKS